jgi:hypothetical protein
VAIRFQPPWLSQEPLIVVFAVEDTANLPNWNSEIMAALKTYEKAAEKMILTK